jgi:hypothetical protein
LDGTATRLILVPGEATVMTRRTTVAVVLTVLVVSSGCLGILSGPVTFSASKATPGDQALEATGYEEANVSKSTISRTFSVADQSKDVEVTNWIATYERTVSIPGAGEQRAAVFSTFSTPQVEVLGQTFNPIDDYSNEDLARQAQDQYGSLSIGNSVGERQVTVLNQSTTVTTFEGQASLQAGQSVDVYIEVTRVKHEGDIVVAVAIYPQQLDGEQQRVNTLLAGLEHDG